MSLLDELRKSQEELKQLILDQQALLSAVPHSPKRRASDVPKDANEI